MHGRHERAQEKPHLKDKKLTCVDNREQKKKLLCGQQSSDIELCNTGPWCITHSHEQKTDKKYFIKLGPVSFK